MTFLGTVDDDGVLRFSGEMNDCCSFLQSLGLVLTSGGWTKEGWMGLIEFHEDKHHAIAWRTGRETSQ